MGLEDLAIFRPIPGCAVLYPCDAYSTEMCVESMARYKGMAYLRTTRPSTTLVYDSKERFPIGGSKVLRKSDQDQVAVITAGITVFEALKAHQALEAEGIYVRVVDAYSVQPVDEENIGREVEESGKKVVVVEDHFQGGGLGDAVASALAGRADIIRLAIKEIPRSGKPEELMDQYGISSGHIVEAVKALIRK